MDFIFTQKFRTDSHSMHSKRGALRQPCKRFKGSCYTFKYVSFYSGNPLCPVISLVKWSENQIAFRFFQKKYEIFHIFCRKPIVSVDQLKIFSFRRSDSAVYSRSPASVLFSYKPERLGISFDIFQCNISCFICRSIIDHQDFQVIQHLWSHKRCKKFIQILLYVICRDRYGKYLFRIIHLYLPPLQLYP